jgi:hypothetical protein
MDELTMAAFAIGSTPALLAGPWVWSRWQARHGRAVAGVSLVSLGFRVAGCCPGVRAGR